MSDNARRIEKREEILKSYIIGYALSILLTLTAYFFAAKHLFSGWDLVLALIALGIIQAFVQLIIFLHLGSESRPRSNLHIFLFTLVVIGIVVGGSLWIMHNLDYRMMSP
jgi:cytochrome o ubiquinol oxidase operon protein cyoD